MFKKNNNLPALLYNHAADREALHFTYSARLDEAEKLRKHAAAQHQTNVLRLPTKTVKGREHKQSITF